jgi:hypothetical protein
VLTTKTAQETQKEGNVKLPKELVKASQFHRVLSTENQNSGELIERKLLTFNHS